ncbi:MAG: hypothetical protein ACI376_02345, partial [Candidatus Bruticola sp.]
MCRSIIAAGAAMTLFCLSCRAWAQEAGGEAAASSGGFVQTLASHILILQIVCGVSAAVFVVCLCWEVWVSIQLHQNGGVLPEPEPDQQESESEAGKDSRFEPPVLDETEDPFKALLNKASSSDDSKKTEEESKTSSRSTAAESGSGFSGVKKLEPYKNVEPIKSSERITRRDQEVPTFDGEATIAVGASVASSKTGGLGVVSGGAIGFGTPPKPPAQPAVGFGSPTKQQNIGFAPPKSPTSGAVGFAPPKSPVSGPASFSPPKSPTSGAVGFAPPKSP